MKIFLWMPIIFLLSLSIASPTESTPAPFDFSWSKISAESEPSLVDWSPDGIHLVIGDIRKAQISILNWQTGEIEWSTTFPDASEFNAFPFHIRWSPDGKSIAVVEKGNVYFVSSQTGELRLLETSTNSSQDEPIYWNARWNPDSSSIAVLDREGYINIISIGTGETIQTMDIAGEMRDHGFWHSVFDWSPDGTLFAVPNEVNGIYPPKSTVEFWDGDGNFLNTYSQRSQIDTNSICSTYGDDFQTDVFDIRWANDSRTLAVAGAYGYGICKLNIDGTIGDHQISEFAMTNLGWSPDQKWLSAVAGYTSLPACLIWITDVADNYQTIEEQIDSESCGAQSLAWSPDSQHLAVATNEGLWIGTFTSQ